MHPLRSGAIKVAVEKPVVTIGVDSHETKLEAFHMEVDPDRNDKKSCSLAETRDVSLCFVTLGMPPYLEEHEASPAGPLARRHTVFITTNIPPESHDPVGKTAALPVILGGSGTGNREKNSYKVHLDTARKDGKSPNGWTMWDSAMERPEKTRPQTKRRHKKRTQKTPTY